MEERIIKCSICEKFIALVDRYGREHKQERYNAIQIIIGHSIGGWGSYKQKFKNEHDKICIECFSVYEEQANAFKKAIEDRKGINRPEVQIINKTWHKVDPMHDVHENKPQPERHKPSLLRFLPFLSR